MDRLRIINLQESDRLKNLLSIIRGNSPELIESKDDIDFTGGAIVIACSEVHAGMSTWLLDQCIKFLRQGKSVLYLNWDGSNMSWLMSMMLAIAYEISLKTASENLSEYATRFQSEVGDKLNISLSHYCIEINDKFILIKECIKDVDIIFIDGQCEPLDKLRRDTLKRLYEILPQDKMLFISCQVPLNKS